MTSYYTTKAWKSLRDAAIKRDGNKCQRCGSSKRLTAHHKLPRADGGLDHLDNLKTVCGTCHIKEHHDYMRSQQQTYNPTREELIEMGLEL
jgi:5-methylcytosine-specific restriction endonuclease McrA